MAEASDDNLLERFTKGDDPAFAEIYARYYRGLFVTCLKAIRPMGRVEDAQDIVSMTFLKLYERRTKMHSLPAITNFLYLAVRTASIDFLRKAGRAIETSQDVTELQAANDELDAAFLERLIQEERVLEMVERLPERSKQVVVLHYLEGMKYREIGERLNISPRTVENQLRYALDKLRTVLMDKKTSGLLLLFTAGLTGTAMIWAILFILLYIS
jgi:RNA polymerase sigma-70 factor (ECF subfamily)